MIERAVESSNKNELLNEFITVPQELKDTVADFNTESERAKANMDKHGYASWYDFCLSEWGTKWDISSSGVHRNGDGSITVCFDSPWGPPIEAYRKFEALGFDVEATYYEPGMMFCGSYALGQDDYIEIPQTADEAEAVIPAYIDEQYGIIEYMREWEEENSEDE